MRKALLARCGLLVVALCGLSVVFGVGYLALAAAVPGEAERRGEARKTWSVKRG